MIGKRLTTNWSLWGKGSTRCFFFLIPTFQRMTISSMRCANKATSEAAERMRASGEQVNEYSASSVTSPNSADKQPAIPNVAVIRGHSRSSSSSAASAAGGSLLYVKYEIKVVYSGKPDFPSNFT